MKLYTAIFLLCFTLNLFGQGQVTSILVTVDLQPKTINVHQELAINLPDSIPSMTLKLLKFNQSISSINMVLVNEKKITLQEETQQEGIRHFSINTPKDESIKKLSISYSLNNTKTKTDIPLFFTELPATHSDADFFKASIHFAQGLDYNINYPKVELEEMTTTNGTTVQFDLAALPSVLRFEKDNKQQIKSETMIDFGAGFLFLIIGGIIYKNRKRLAYG